MKPLPSKGPNSPFSPSGRTLLARTCPYCGELADGDSFPILNAGTRNLARRKACHKCHNARKKRDRIQRGIGVPAPRPPVLLQTRTKARWSAADDKYLRENINARTYEEMAVTLGRSLAAVYKRRDILGLVAVRRRHRVAKPWKVRNDSSNQ